MTRSLVAVLLFVLAASASAQVRYGTGTWDRTRFGNHRAVVRVRARADAVLAHVEWRRRDAEPGRKKIVVVDATTGNRLGNVVAAAATRDAGDIVFQPLTVPGDYYVYYLPYTSSGRSNYPTVTYAAAEATAAPDWLDAHQLRGELSAREAWKNLPQAELLEIQAVQAFDSFYPMEVVASVEEMRVLAAFHAGAPFLLFPEDRSHPIRMTDDLPQRWMMPGPPEPLRASVSPGEFFAFQVGVFALERDLQSIQVRFAALAGPITSIPVSAFRSFNTAGIDSSGRAFAKVLRVAKGKVQPLWMGIDVPREQQPGEYSGRVSVTAPGAGTRTIELRLRVTGAVLIDSGDAEPERHSRLRWLDSTLAQDDSVVPPFTPVIVTGNAVRCLGRGLSLGPSGLPVAIQSFFSPEVTQILQSGREVLASPVSFVVEDSGGHALPWSSGGVRFVKRAEGTAAWEARSHAGTVEVDTQGTMDFDGNVEYRVTLRASQKTDLRDVRLEFPLRADVARFMMGLGRKGGIRPNEYRWKWDQKKNQDSVWIGDVNAGLQLSLKDENYVRPLNTNFYLLKPLNMPPSWFNGGRGGIDIGESEPARVIVRAYSGPRTLQPGDDLHFNFRLALTPFKPLDTRGQWSTRYYHRYRPVEEIAQAGANTVNVHHATEINPYINYPFLRPREMKEYVDAAHRLGQKVKIYYTVRELSNRASELFALRSLGDEVFLPGPGGGFPWLQEHLGNNYIAGWLVPDLEDAAVVNSGVSRWHNYYVEGLNWLVKNVGIDGLYIDDVAFDRITMKRVRKVLDRGRDGALIDLHSANQFNARDGFANSANLYLEHFPYLNRLWFGEYFDYNGSPPDFWLVEISGIPFGLMGEMLQDGGNPWRGMVFGMTSRLPWAGDPTSLWRLWDQFGIQDSRMVGHWSPSCPVRTGRDDVLATAYVRKDRTLVSLASWAAEPVQCRLVVDWKALGLDPSRARFTAPLIRNFQEAAQFAPGDPIPVAPGKGWLLTVTDR